MRKIMRNLALALPPIRRLLTHRDALLVERDALRGEHDALLGERDTLRGERDALLVERKGLRGKRHSKPSPGMPTPTFDKLSSIMKKRFTIDNVVSEHKSNFEEMITKELGHIDPDIEGYEDQTRQRDFSVKYHWGHNHDFGSFSLKGLMRDRHLQIISKFVDTYGLPLDLSGKKILDVGVWTGGTSLLLSAMGAEVTALEEVKKYANTVNYLAKSFGVPKLICHAVSLYDLNEHDTYDYVHYSGVVYHVTDPILSLRILFNALKDGGKIFIESAAIEVDKDRPLALIKGP